MANKDTCNKGHDLLAENARYFDGRSFRCRECNREKSRAVARKRLGIALDKPVRQYNKTPAQTHELIQLILAKPELAKSLLAIAKEVA